MDRFDTREMIMLGQAMEQIVRSAEQMDDARACLTAVGVPVDSDVPRVPEALTDRTAMAAKVLMDLRDDYAEFMAGVMGVDE